MPGWTGRLRTAILYFRREPTHHPPGRLTDLMPDQRIRRSWWIFAGTFVLLTVLLSARLLLDGGQPLDWIVAALVARSSGSPPPAPPGGRRPRARPPRRGRVLRPDPVGPLAVGLRGRDRRRHRRGARRTATGADHIVVVRRAPRRRRSRPLSSAPAGRRAVHDPPGRREPRRAVRPPDPPAREPAPAIRVRRGRELPGERRRAGRRGPDRRPRPRNATG